MEEAEWRKTKFKSEVHCIPTYIIVKTIQDMSHHFKLICDNYESHRTQYYIHASLVPPSEKTPSFVQAFTSIHSCTINHTSGTIPIHPLE